MTGDVPGSPAMMEQDSLFSLAEEAALYRSGMVPDTAALTRFLTGELNGLWHAVERAQDAPGQAAAADGPALLASAVCGATVRVTEFGVYDRVGFPVSCGPCPACAWAVAIATGSTERELLLLTPDDRTATALSRMDVDPYLTVEVCRAVLAQCSDPDAEYEAGDPPIVQVLGHATAHAPVLWVPEDCAEDPRACRHRPDGAGPDGEDWQCDYPEASAGCGTCSLRSGPWAGEREGKVMDQCRVAAPCDALRALAAHLAPLQPWRPSRSQLALVESLLAGGR